MNDLSVYIALLLAICVEGALSVALRTRETGGGRRRADLSPHSHIFDPMS